MAGKRGNGEGTIRRRPNGTWEARLTLPGGQRKSLYGKTRADVAQRLTAARRDLDQGLPVAADERQTVADYLATWLDAVRPTLKPRTWERYSVTMRNHVIPAFGGLRLSRLTAQHLQSFYAAKLEEGLSPTTVNHMHANIHRALDAAVRLGILPRNVADLVTPPRPATTEMHVLTAEQVQTLLEAARGNRLEALYVLALTTGMRRGELLALTWADVDLDARAVQVRQTLHHAANGEVVLSQPKTARSRRRIELTQRAVDALRQHRARQLTERLAAGPAWQDRDFVFARARDGAPLRGAHVVERHFLPFLARAGLPRIRFHDLRHTAATLMLRQGIHPKVVSEMLGHSQISITLDRYSHVLPTMQRDAAAALDRLLSGEVVKA